MEKILGFKNVQEKLEMNVIFWKEKQNIFTLFVVFIVKHSMTFFQIPNWNIALLIGKRSHCMIWTIGMRVNLPNSCTFIFELECLKLLKKFVNRVDILGEQVILAFFLAFFGLFFGLFCLYSRRDAWSSLGILGI